MELGQGFAFMGRQYPITVDNETYFWIFFSIMPNCIAI